MQTVERGVENVVGGTAHQVTKVINTLRAVLFWIPISFAILALILVSVWASRDRVSFLGKPNWESNIFPWHPVLMVAGFFFSQVLAICSWQMDVMPSPAGGVFSWQKFFHVFWNSAAVATMITALYAVFKYRANINRSHLATNHEWTGIFIAILTVLQYFIGLTFTLWRTATIYHGALGNHSPEENAKTLNTIGGMRKFHKFMGLTILGLTGANILSGLVQRQLTCPYYVDKYTTGPYYENLDIGCRISNGVAIAVWIATISTVMLVLTRYDIKPLDLGTHGNTEAIVDRGLIRRENAGDPSMYQDVKGNRASEEGVDGGGGARANPIGNRSVEMGGDGGGAVQRSI